MTIVAILTSNAKIAILGAGRLGSSLAIAFDRADRNVVALSTRRAEHRDWLHNQLPEALITDDFRNAAANADVAFITVSDRYICEIADACNWHPEQAVVHCSGVSGLELLEAATQAGARAGAMHPLQTFPSFDSAPLLHGITFAIESADEALAQWLNECVQNFDGFPITISGKTQRVAYHASAVLSCGLLAGLVGVAAEMWEQFGIDRDTAVKRIAPMVASTAAAVQEHGIPDALTGPYTRGDLETVRKHLTATFDISTDTSRAYAALALAQLHLAQAQGHVDEQTMAKIRNTLIEHLETI